MSDMQKLIQTLTDLEKDSTLMEGLEECGDQMSGQEQPVSIHVTAAGKEHVNDLLDMMKNAGLGDAGVVDQHSMPMRQDIETFRGVVDAEPGEEEMRPTVEAEDDEDYEEMDDFANSYSDDKDEAEYQDTQYMTRDLSGGLNREKDGYPAAQDGDNAMTADIRKSLESRLKEMLDDEQLDEISTDTLRSYKDKARKDADAKHSELRKTREPHQMPQTDDEKELARKSQDRYAQSNKATKKVSRRDPKPSNPVTDKYPLGGRDPKSGRSYSS